MPDSQTINYREMQQLSPEQRQRHYADIVATRKHECPTCQAPPGQECKSPSGQPIYNVGNWPIYHYELTDSKGRKIPIKSKRVGGEPTRYKLSPGISRLTVHRTRRHLVTGSPKRPVACYQGTPCPKCHADTDQPCVSKSGAVLFYSHKTRRPLSSNATTPE